MKTLTVASLKGGTGKSTSSIIMALLLAEKNRVLLIDMDKQATTTSFFLTDEESYTGFTILEAMRDNILLRCIHNVTTNLSLIPATIDFQEIDFFNRIGKEIRLRKALEQVADQFDFVVIDTAPDLGTATGMALVAADAVLVPVRLERMDVRAIRYTLAKCSEVKDDFNPDLKTIRILPTQYSYQNRTVHDAAFDLVKSELGKLVLDVKIPQASITSQFNFRGHKPDMPLKNFDEYRQVIKEIFNGKVI